MFLYLNILLDRYIISDESIIDEIIITKFKSKDIHSLVFDDYTRAIVDQSVAGLNTMSISEMTGLPRATVIRKLKSLEKNNSLTSNSKKQFYLPNPNSQMNALMKKNFIFKSEFIARTLNLIIV